MAASNEGTMDCFRKKQDSDVSGVLRHEIRRLQGTYFADISNPIRCALALQNPSFFTDPGFIELFDEISKNNGIVEYYVCASPPGMMMRDAEGTELFLLISDLDTVNSQCEVAEHESAPADMVQLLRTGKAQAWFPTQEGFYHPNFESTWVKYIWPAQLLPGSRAWTYSFVRHDSPAE
jgi:hypothetical protein